MLTKTEVLRWQIASYTQKLVEAAKTDARYPVRFNHCFQRIAYDSATGFTQRWDNAVQRPFIHNATEAQLRVALTSLMAMANDPQKAVLMNQKSLSIRI